MLARRQGMTLRDKHRLSTECRNLAMQQDYDCGAKLFRGLGHPVRLQILEILARTLKESVQSSIEARISLNQLAE
jgi:hypothetical protein